MRDGITVSAWDGENEGERVGSVDTVQTLQTTPRFDARPIRQSLISLWLHLGTGEAFPSGLEQDRYDKHGRRTIDGFFSPVNFFPGGPCFQRHHKTFRDHMYDRSRSGVRTIRSTVLRVSPVLGDRLSWRCKDRGGPSRSVVQMCCETVARKGSLRWTYRSSRSWSGIKGLHAAPPKCRLQM
ncbi:uncharacterized protein BJX67DRAFT_320704 [Aspergillus lucknowensis]|uniref:Uncharacterized protein n=1 Tax=Aspergillus lucknowensis TaxID=176173 RepID=A0ABR4LYY2_9EURO